MPDHLHWVWMGLRHDTQQRNGVKFLRAQLGPAEYDSRSGFSVLDYDSHNA
jgi:hypothetical protein